MLQTTVEYVVNGFLVINLMWVYTSCPMFTFLPWRIHIYTVKVGRLLPAINPLLFVMSSLKDFAVVLVEF